MRIGKYIEIRTSLLVFGAALCGCGFAEEFFLAISFAGFHELCHISTAAAFGLQTRKITVSPIGWSAEIPGLGNLSYAKRILVIATAPVFNLFAGLFFAALDEPLCYGVNFGIFILNMLPVLPLDGGRLLYTALGRHMGVLRALKAVCAIGKGVSAAVCALGVIQLALFPFNAGLLIIGLFMFYGAKTQKQIETTEFIKFLYDRERSPRRREAEKIRFILCAGKPQKDIRRFNYDDYFIVIAIKKSSVGRRIISIPMEETINRAFSV